MIKIFASKLTVSSVIIFFENFKSLKLGSGNLAKMSFFVRRTLRQAQRPGGGPGIYFPHRRFFLPESDR